MVHLLGYSLGGMIAQASAAKHPKLVRKAVFVSMGPHGGEEHLMQASKEAQSHKEAPDPRLPRLLHVQERARMRGWPFSNAQK